MDEPEPTIEEVAPVAAVPWGGRDLVIAFLVALGLSVLGFVAFAAVAEGASDLVFFGIAGGVIYLCVSFSFWWFVVRKSDATWDQVGFREIEPVLVVKLLGWTLVTLFLSGAASALVEVITGRAPSSAAPLFPEAPTTEELLITTVLACLIAPLVEEFIFRGLLLGSLRKRFKVGTAVAVSAALFALFHFIPIQLAPLFVFGVMFGFVRVRYDNVWASVLLHAMVNGIAIWVSFALLTG